MSLARDEILHTLIGAMEAMDAVLALWEGGAAAFGRVDAFSDIDISAVVKVGQVENVAQAAKLALVRVGGAAREYRQRSYHGDTQFFWQLDGISPFNFVDMDLIEWNTEASRIDRGIHGDPIIHFDKCGCVAVVEEEPDARRARIREGIERIAAVSDLQPLLVRKYILRNEPLHAYGMYQRWMVQPLIELLRMKHCPERRSFHTTYLMWDLPPEVTDRLAPLMMPTGIDDITRSLPVVEDWIRTLIGQLHLELA